MRSSYTPELRPDGHRFAALAAAIRHDIERGRLCAGDRLPGSRTLAVRLGLGRNTVVRVYRELESEGWMVAARGSGMRVAPHLAAEPRPPRPSPGLGFEVPFDALSEDRRLHAPARCKLAMLGGQPDLRLLPLTELARAYRRVLNGRGRRLVGYGDPYGEPRLRDALATWLAETRGLAQDPARLLITRGSQMALYLLARALLRPGDRVAVEDHGYAPAWNAFRHAGATLEGVPVDAEGLVVEALPDGVRAIYVTPHHQYPTGALLSAERRQRLLAWAAARRVPIIEDDYDHEYHYEGTPVLPLAALDRDGVVIYVGTLSKAFAPGLRLGWIHAHPALLEPLAMRRRHIDRQGDRVVELAVAELLEDGLIGRHIRKTRRAYQARRDALLEGLTKLPVFPVPAAGGMALWCRTEVDADRWASAAEARGLFFTSGSAYTLDRGATPHVRLGFAALTEEEIAKALRIAKRSLRDIAPSGRR